jgi:acyl transferase domain-containing protein
MSVPAPSISPLEARNGALTTSWTNGMTNGAVNGYSKETTNGNSIGNYISSKSIGVTDHLAGATSELLDAGAIAICGIGLRLPGGIRNTDSFWDLLINGKDARGPIPSSRYNIDGFDASLGGKGAIITRHGYFLHDDLSQLDASFFSMSKNELEKCDPQQRQLLEVTRECLEDAGEVGYRGRRIGCYVGTFGEDWLQMSARETQHSSGYILGGHLDIMLANRISYEYDLKGPR